MVIFFAGEIMVGSSGRSSSGAHEMFRGCLGPSRIQGVLLPFISQLDLINNTAQNQFIRMVRQSSFLLWESDAL